MQDRWADYIDTPRTERFWTGLVIGFVWGALVVTVAAVWWTHDRAIVREAARAKVDQAATHPLYYENAVEPGKVTAPNPRFTGARPHVVTLDDVGSFTSTRPIDASVLRASGTTITASTLSPLWQQFTSERVPSTALVQP